MIQIVVLALLQSLTEFLPVSSSGHLILLPFLMRWQAQGIAVDIGLHIGTLLAVIVYFKKDIWHLLQSLFIKGKSKTLLLNLFIASVPIAVAGVCLLPLWRMLRRNYTLVAIMLIVFGILLWLADKYAKKDGKITPKNALIIGLAQCLSLIPGVSRSGITITAARLCQVSRTEATRFSMLLSIPTISMAFVWVLYRSFIQNIPFDFNLQFQLGMLFAFIFGLMVIFALMSFIKNHSFWVFMLYRIILGCFLLLYIWL